MTRMDYVKTGLNDLFREWALRYAGENAVTACEFKQILHDLIFIYQRNLISRLE